MKKSKISVGRRTPINAKMPRASTPVDCGNRAEPRRDAIKGLNPQVHSAEWEGEAPGLPITGAVPRSIARRWDGARPAPQPAVVRVTPKTVSTPEPKRSARRW